MSIWDGAASAGIGATTAMLSMIGQRKREDRAMENQKELMGLQFGHQQKLNKQGSDLQYQMWKKTNFPAQVAMLEEAGLSTGLMYGMSGAGGTTGSQSGGSAASGNAPAPQPMDIDNMVAAAQTAADVKLKEAQARNLNVDADKKEGVDTDLTKMQISDLSQGIKNKKAQELLTKTENRIKQLDEQYQWESLSDRVAQIKATANTAWYNMEIANNESKLSERTLQTKIALLGRELINQTLKSKQISEQTREIGVRLTQEWERLSLTIDDIGTKKHANAINEFEAKVWAELEKARLGLYEKKIIVDGLSRAIGAGVEMRGQNMRR